MMQKRLFSLKDDLIMKPVKNSAFKLNKLYKSN